MEGSELQRQWCAVNDADDRHPLGSRGLHHRNEILHPMLPGFTAVLRARVGQPGAATVETNEPAERCEPAVETRARGILPLEIELSPLTGSEDQVQRAFAQDLVGDAVVAVGVTSFRG